MIRDVRVTGRRRFWFGVTVTALWFFFWTFWSRCDSSGTCFWPLTSNAWGDWAAGTAAPIAFLWLILGFRQQADELQQNTDALRHQEQTLAQQVSELKASVAAQDALVQVTREQARASSQASRVSALATLAPFQPIFIGGMVSAKNENRELISAVTNVGYPITRVTIQVDEGQQKSFSARPIRIVEWPRNGRVDVTVTHKSLGPANVKLILTFFDGLNIRQAQVLNVYENEDRGPVYVERVPSGPPNLPPVDTPQA